MISMLVLSLRRNLHLVFALLYLMAGSAGIAIADVTIDACVTQNSINHPSLAGDMQSLCGLSSSIGALVGFSLSGFLVHLVGSKVSLCSLLLVATCNEQNNPFALLFQSHNKLNDSPCLAKIQFVAPDLTICYEVFANNSWNL